MRSPSTLPPRLPRLTFGGLALLFCTLFPSDARALDILPVSYSVVAESGTQNGLVDPGETLTVSFTIFNNGFDATNNLVATVRPTPQIVGGGAAQSFGVVESGDIATLTFTVTASSVAYQPVRVIFDLTDGAATGEAIFELSASQQPPIPARAGFTINSESFLPANGLPDVGETVTVLLSIKNNGLSPSSNLNGTLVAATPVNASGTPQNFGAIAPGATVSRPFTFTVTGAANTTYNLVLNLTDSGLNYGSATFNGFRTARAAQLVVDAVALTSESASPANGSPDPGEIVTAAVTLRNVGESNADAISAQLVASGGVLAPSPATAQSFGQIVGGGAVTRSFTFTGGSACGAALDATFALFDGATALPSLTYSWLAGFPTQTFTNATSLALPATGTSGPASPYPSVINVSGLAGNTTRVTLGLRGFAHALPTDVDVLLVSPTGQTLVPQAACGGFNALTGAGVDLNFSASAAAQLPTTVLTSGTFLPTNRRANNPFPGPAPVGPFGSTLAGFNGSPPGGAWSLYVNDVAESGAGALQRGWTLTVTTATASCLDTSTDLAVALSGVTAVPVAGQPYTALCQIVNNTPNPASGVQATITLPAGATYVGASSPQGSVSFLNGVVTVAAGVVNGLSTLPVTVQFVLVGAGAKSVGAGVTLLQTDSNGMNNSATLSLNALADSDGDGIPDDWEITYGFNPNDSRDAQRDADGDGLTNLQEFLAGTDPRNAASGLRVLAVTRDGAGCNVTFASVGGRSYRLERRALLESGGWTTVQSSLTGTGSNLVVTDPAPPAGKQFYRVVLLP